MKGCYFLSEIWRFLFKSFDKVCIVIYKFICIFIIFSMCIAMLSIIFIVLSIIKDFIPTRFVAVMLIETVVPVIFVLFLIQIIQFSKYFNKISLRHNYKPFLVIVWDKITENLVPLLCVVAMFLISLCLALINSFGYNADDFVLVVMAVLANALYSLITRNTNKYEENKLMIDNIRDIFLVGIIGYWLIDKYKDDTFLKEITWLLNADINIAMDVLGVLIFILISIFIAMVPLAVLKSFKHSK